MNTLRILHIDSERAWGGGQRQVAGLCSYLRDGGHSVTLVCPPDSALREWAGDHGFGVRPADFRSSADLRSAVHIARVVRDVAPDIVHCHASRAHILGAAGARLAGFCRVLVTRRNQDPVHMVWPNTWAYRRAVCRIVAVSEAVANSLAGVGIDRASIRVIRSGIDVGHFEQAVPDQDLRRGLAITESAPVILSCAKLTPIKGLQYLIDAVAILSKRGLNTCLVIAGVGECLSGLRAQASAAGICATLPGFVEDTAPLIALSDVFAMPSLMEGLGTAVIEAMAAGKPVVASAVGGVVETVVDGVTGYLVPPRDPVALADRLSDLISRPEAARAMGAEGMKRARENFSMERMASLNEALYHEIMSDRPGSR